MKNKIGTLGLFLSFLVCGSAVAVPQIWKDSESSLLLPEQKNTLAKQLTTPLKVRTLELNMPALVEQLNANIGTIAKAKDATSIQPVITIPLPEGGVIRVSVKKSEVMAPELAKQFPNIKTWSVIGKDNKNIYGVIDITDHGFHAMLVMPDGDTVFVDPEKTSNNYLNFSKRENAEHFHNSFQCQVHSNDFLLGQNQPQQSNSSQSDSFAKSALNNITYRLAVATTGEYTQYHGGVNGALGAISTTISRINEVYQRDLGIKFQLIAEQANIIYTRPNSDPYTNSSLSDLKLENIDNLNRFNALARSRYDIGHVFARAHLGGLANFAAVCDDERKAGGASGLSSPIGEAFDIDIVAHELGHQLGALHTFNSACGVGQRTALTAVEPGSGSTIMSYAGECSPNNLQSSVDAQFHAASIIQILNYSRKKGGSQCGIERGTSNQNPLVNAGPDYTIPAITPFMLVANGSDSDGDTLSYTWEQSDTGTESDVDVDTGDNALIRSRAANISRIRYIPRLNDLFRGVAVRGEHLPVNDRAMHFMATVRDGKGGIEIDEMKVQISSTGRTFSVTSHRFANTLFAGDDTTVTWDVAGTNLSPISCQAIDISFVQADGTKEKLTTTANDGEKTLTIPTDVPNMSDARLMLSCRDNLFFNVSRGRLTITNEDFVSGGSGDSSGGGSMGFFLTPLLFIALLRRKTIKKEAVS